MSTRKCIILHVTGAISGGGAERQLHLLLNGLTTIDHHIYSLHRGGEDLYADTAVSLHFRTGGLGCWGLAKLLVKIKPDIVHCWIPATLPYVLPAVYWYGKSKLLLIASIQSAYRLDRFKRRLQLKLFGLANRIVSNVHPDNMLPAYRKRFLEKQGAFIPNGLDLSGMSLARRLPPTALDDKLKVPFILFAGRLIPDKNLPVILRALVRLPEAQLVICGEGDLTVQIRSEVTRLGLDDRVFFMGFRRDIYAIMRSAKVFVLSSYREGMPNVAFEAAAAGCLLALSRIPVHTSWFKDYAGAQFFDKDDDVQLAGILQSQLKLKSHPDPNSLLQPLAPASFIAAYQDLYLRAIEQAKK